MNPLIFIIKTRNFILNKISKKFPYPSIGIGGITMGGSGKTPLTIEILKFLKKKNINCALLTRGYRRKDKNIKIIFDEKEISPSEIGDEPYLIFKKLNIPMGIHKDRVKSAKELLKKSKIDIFVLDDAMQIKKYYFDLNIFVATEKELFEREKFFPEGISRDFRNELFKGDLVIVNQKMKGIKKYRIKFFDRKKIPYFFACYEIKGFYNIFGERLELKKFDKILLVTGIANPSSLKSYIKRNYNLREHIKFLDHHYYTERDLKEILKLREKLKCDYIITTEKDIVRFPLKEKFIIYPEIKMIIEDGFYDYLSGFIKKIKSC